MKSKKNKLKDQENKGQKKVGQKHLNPFKENIRAKENEEIVKEEITGEQQRKQAITERD
jgi:hypothetical protein